MTQESERIISKASCLDYDRCVDFLIRMMEKYGNDYSSATVDEIRDLFPKHQSKKAA